MEIFSPVFWLAMMYSPGEDVASIFTRAFARSRSGATSIQRSSLASTLKMSNGGIMGDARIRPHYPTYVYSIQDSVRPTLSPDLRFSSRACLRRQAQRGAAQVYGELKNSHMAGAVAASPGSFVTPSPSSVRPRTL